MAISTPETVFTRDVFGRYVCNTLAEATASGPFDVIIIGGGTFGLALAQDLFFRSKRTGPGTVPQDSMRPPNYRILVLEAGPFVFDEHTQDIPNLQLSSPGAAPEGYQPTPGAPLPATRQQLIALGLDKQPLFETWGLPWNSAEPFGGLAYCLGGRSLYWGGWSPRYLDTEMHLTPVGTITAQTLWPATVVQDLHVRFFLEAAKQTGVTTSNEFINGALHDYCRERLFNAYGAIPDAVPLGELPDYAAEASEDIGARLQTQLAAPPYPGFAQSVLLDAPLAVQIQARPGFFPFNKFSSMPEAITAARGAFGESGGNDALKRLMIVPNCHVKRLTTRPYTLATGVTVEEVDGIDTSSGFIDLTGTIAANPNRRPIAVLAMGAIESARVARLSAGGVPNANQIGTNFMVHVRKNVAFTVPLAALPAPAPALPGPDISALLLRCRRDINGTPVHYHFQITAAALPAGAPAGQADAWLFQKVPDLDTIRSLAQTAPGEVGVIIRAVGEKLPDLANNAVTVPLQPPDNDEYTVPRASVTVGRGPEDGPLQAQMDQVIRDVAQTVFGMAPLIPDPAGIPPDGLGTTFHESGTLRMGDDPVQSVTNAEGQFHFVTNLYAGDASVLPTCGSANPVMNGVALRRRLAKRLIPEGDGIGGRPIPPYPSYAPPMPPAPPAAGTVIPLFDGQTLANWRMAGRGTFHVTDGALQSVPSFDLGLLWSTHPMPQNYRLELEFFIRLLNTNSGVFVRFTNPESSGDYNPAWAAVASGFEVQIDNTGAASAPQPQGLPKHRTGAIYAVNYPGDPAPDPNLPPAQPGDFVNPQDAQVLAWNAYRVDVQGDVISVNLNGVDTARYTNTDPNRGRFSPNEPTFIGLQSYSNYSFTTAFRNIRVTVLP